MNLRKWRQHDRGASVPDPQTSPTITDALSREPPDDGPGQGFASGLRWSAGNVVVGRALSMVSTIVLARILAPEVFGIFAVTLVVLTGLISVNDFGTTNAIVRWPGSPDRAARTATSLAWTGSTLACALAVMVAPLIAGWSHAPSARLPMQVLALGVLVDGIAAVPGAMLTRNFQQKRRTTADFASLIASVGLSIGLALAGAGIWALVLGRLVGNVMGTIAVVIVAPSRPRPGWNRDDARTLLRFGIPLVGASALVFVMANLDTIVIARVVGAGAALGFYALAFNLSSWPLNVLSGMLRRVSLPLFASHQHDDEQLTSSVLGTVQLVGAVAALPAMLLGALALWIITVVYGEKWTPAAAPLTFLAALGWVRVLGELAWDALIANGRTRRVLAVQGAWTLILAPALIVGVQLDGIRGAAIAHTAVALIVVIPAFALALRRMGATPGALARRVVRPVATALVIGVGAWGAATWISGPAWLVVTIVGPTSALLFAAVVWRPSSVRAGWRDILGRPEELQPAR